jgi:hypothetical protein
MCRTKSSRESASSVGVKQFKPIVVGTVGGVDRACELSAIHSLMRTSSGGKAGLLRAGVG